MYFFSPSVIPPFPRWSRFIRSLRIRHHCLRSSPATCSKARNEKGTARRLSATTQKNTTVNAERGTLSYIRGRRSLALACVYIVYALISCINSRRKTKFLDQLPRKYQSVFVTKSIPKAVKKWLKAKVVESAECHLSLEAPRRFWGWSDVRESKFCISYRLSMIKSMEVIECLAKRECEEWGRPSSMSAREYIWKLAKVVPFDGVVADRYIKLYSQARWCPLPCSKRTYEQFLREEVGAILMALKRRGCSSEERK
ncbi:uncharacterized protein LOC126317509 [Schistocerca gregaria]|uniref:uncharacterized protein LOC126317509 n=1 Tax=Schistocerca gregaria TaxID=7010 RepID=UPI00211E7ADC|nr:uncharacterized protein LOC126317509 [Schistocerca gregaria]